MNFNIINDKHIYAKKIFLYKSNWFLEGKDKDNKTVLIKLSEINSFNGNFIDEVVIIRPLTNKIYVDEKTNDVLKIYVDQKDFITDIIHENRFAPKIQIKLPDLSIDNTFAQSKKKR